MERAFRILIALAFLVSAARAEDALGRAAALVNQGRYAEAARAYEDLAGRDPSNASLHHSLGLCRQALGDYPRAAASLERAASLSADPSEAAYSLALLHEALADGPDRARRLAQARDAWRAVVTRGSGERARTAARHIERIEEELGGGR